MKKIINNIKNCISDINEVYLDECCPILCGEMNVNEEYYLISRLNSELSLKYSRKIYEIIECGKIVSYYDFSEKSYVAKYDFSNLINIDNKSEKYRVEYSLVTTYFKEFKNTFNIMFFNTQYYASDYFYDEEYNCFYYDDEDYPAWAYNYTLNFYTSRTNMNIPKQLNSGEIFTIQNLGGECYIETIDNGDNVIESEYFDNVYAFANYAQYFEIIIKSSYKVILLQDFKLNNYTNIESGYVKINLKSKCIGDKLVKVIQKNGLPKFISLKGKANKKIKNNTNENFKSGNGLSFEINSNFTESLLLNSDLSLTEEDMYNLILNKDVKICENPDYYVRGYMKNGYSLYLKNLDSNCVCNFIGVKDYGREYNVTGDGINAVRVEGTFPTFFDRCKEAVISFNIINNNSTNLQFVLSIIDKDGNKITLKNQTILSRGRGNINGIVKIDTLNPNQISNYIIEAYALNSQPINININNWYIVPYTEFGYLYKFLTIVNKKYINRDYENIIYEDYRLDNLSEFSGYNGVMLSDKNIELEYVKIKTINKPLYNNVNRTFFN